MRVGLNSVIPTIAFCNDLTVGAIDVVHNVQTYHLTSPPAVGVIDVISAGTAVDGYDPVFGVIGVGVNRAGCQTHRSCRRGMERGKEGVEGGKREVPARKW